MRIESPPQINKSIVYEFPSNNLINQVTCQNRIRENKGHKPFARSTKHKKAREM
ncbi:unnamed protein product [marine sediment metagenome]|uniref:Uncharacterized protein n=1 Tax=marine sediment metagenome TaxID=412755 RepID=X0ZSQ5_9ZZZZ